MINETALVTILLFGITLSSNSIVISQPQKSEGASAKLKTFLETSEELRNYARNGYTSNFTGDFRPIPINLQGALSEDLPEFKFHVAKMSVLIDPPQKTYDLILITSANTGEVRAFVWGNFWMMPPSGSFGLLLKGYQAKSKDFALDKVKSLAKLIAYAANVEVGNAKAGHGKLKVELLRGEGVFGFLELKIDKHFRLGRLSITAPNGKTPRYFVSHH